MSLLLLEAFGALVLLIFIVWWTMFSGRKNGELKDDPNDDLKDDPKDDLNSDQKGNIRNSDKRP